MFGLTNISRRSARHLLGKSAASEKRLVARNPTAFRWMASESAKRTCLYDFHRERQARMEAFAGYSMPIVYKDQTITQEHMQTREQAAAFDVSHMMQTLIRGKDRHKFIESLTVADVQQMALNKCALSVLTNPAGGIIDDCIIAKRPDHLHVVSNAGNATTVWDWLVANKGRELDVHLERWHDQGLVALQGPKAAQVLQSLVAQLDLNEIEFMETSEAEISGVGKCIVTRCGYTGEDGFEISVDPSRARALMDQLCAQASVRPAGLGARDTLRLEAGLCLHGHDITTQTTPVEAALSWVVHKRRRADGGFPGHEVIARQLQEGTSTRRLGLVARGAGPPARESSAVKEGPGGEKLGSVTSGTFAPKLGKNIAMAYLPSGLAKGVKEQRRALVCQVRGRDYEYELTPMPFVKSNYYVKSRAS